MSKMVAAGSWVTAPLKKEMLISVNQSIEKSKEGAAAISPIISSLIGVAQIGGMRGAMRFLEMVSASLQEGKLSKEDYAKLVAPSLTIFARYIDRELSGEAVSSLILFKAHQALALAIGAPAPYEGVIFYPWNIVSIYDKDDSNPNKVSDDKFKEFAETYLKDFSKASADLENSSAKALQGMRQALITLETKNPHNGLRLFFDSAIAAMDSLTKHGVKNDAPVIGMIAEQLKHIVDGKVTSDEDTVSSLMFVVAKNKQTGARSNRLRNGYKLDDLIASVTNNKKAFSFNDKQRDFMKTLIKQLETESESASTGNTAGFIEAIGKMAGLKTAPDPVVSIAGEALGLAVEAIQAGVSPANVVMESAVILSILSDVVDGQRNETQQVMIGRQRNALLALAGKDPVIDTNAAAGSAMTEDFRQQLMIEVRAELNLVELVADNIVNGTLDEGQKSALSRSFGTIGGALTVLGDKDASALVKYLSAAVADKGSDERQKIVDGIGYLSSFVDAYRSGAKDASNLLLKGLGIFREEAKKVEVAAVVHGEDTDAPNDEFLLEVFLDEAGEVMKTVQDNIKTLKNGHDKEAMVTIRRSFHTMKGSSRMVGLERFGEAAWAGEQVMNTWMTKELPCDAKLLDFIEYMDSNFGIWVNDLTEQKQVTVNVKPVQERGDEMQAYAESLKSSGGMQPAATAKTPEQATVAAPEPVVFEPAPIELEAVTFDVTEPAPAVEAEPVVEVAPVVEPEPVVAETPAAVEAPAVVVEAPKAEELVVDEAESAAPDFAVEPEAAPVVVEAAPAEDLAPVVSNPEPEAKFDATDKVGIIEQEVPAVQSTTDEWAGDVYVSDEGVSKEDPSLRVEEVAEPEVAVTEYVAVKPQITQEDVERLEAEPPLTSYQDDSVKASWIQRLFAKLRSLFGK